MFRGNTIFVQRRCRRTAASRAEVGIAIKVNRLSYHRAVVRGRLIHAPQSALLSAAPMAHG
jgi:hypothetical protein